MARGKNSTIQRHRGGCLSGCLVRLILLLGIVALIFVVGCMTGVISNDPVDGKPVVNFSNLHAPDMSSLNLDFQNLKGVFDNLLANLPPAPFSTSSSGMTLRTLRAGSGEAILVTADGYSMLMDAGSGGGLLLSGELLLSGIRHLDVAAALSSDDANIGGMQRILSFFKPSYLLYSASQTKGSAFEKMISEAEKQTGIQQMAAQRGMAFQLGRGNISCIGPGSSNHQNSQDDGLSFCVDYGMTRILVLGTITQAGAEEIVMNNRGLLASDAIVCGNGGKAVTSALLDAVRPKVVYVCGAVDEAAVSRIRTWGADVYTVKEKGIMTINSDGTTLKIQP